MARKLRDSNVDVCWGYSWNISEEPVVRFNNPEICTNVIFTLAELKKILKCTDKENEFIPVPRSVMQSALDMFKSQLLMKVQGSMAA